MSSSLEFLKHSAYNLRVLSVIATTKAGSGHPTSCLSAADLVAAIFFHAMRFDPKNYTNRNNDRFILSKGHAAPLLYAVWNQIGIVDEQDLFTLRRFGSKFEGHPTLQFPQSEAATGSLGQGLSIGLGMAYSTRITKYNFNVYVLLGDGELAEGSVWEACELAAYYKVQNLIGIVDCNHLGQTGNTMNSDNAAAYAIKFSSFGWKAIVVDGHNIEEIIQALDEARQTKNQPTMIIARTVKGYGIDRIENIASYHGKAFSSEELPQVLEHLKQRFHKESLNPKNRWNPIIPIDTPTSVYSDTRKKLQVPYTIGQKIATRKAYGEALVAVGGQDGAIVVLDADVKNSTGADLFATEYPSRFIQCFIAEQNMIGMAVGLANRGLVPFAGTFGAFFSRAFDQIRMAAVGTAALRLIGSHAGVSIGEDGPSQMALEDIAIMRTLPGSVVLYPSDAVATARLVEAMVDQSDGITYLRTTRMATSVLYPQHESFIIGGCKVLKESDQDIACVVGAGITLHEALKAYDILQERGISIAVIDLYSIKPFDEKTLYRIGKKSKGRIITVEDHYRAGGIGEAVAARMGRNLEVTILSVTNLAHSGSPEALLAAARIDADAIVKLLV
jgi:transketolase